MQLSVRFAQLYPLHPSRVRKLLQQQAKVDIQPLVRRAVWAALLDIDEAAARREYAQFDPDVVGASDHQIELDIPRCHQYHPLLSSPAGHDQLRRVLRCWVASNAPELVYWQGLDSVLAPFVVLFFGDDALALACLNAFVKRHLRRVFIKDNTIFLQVRALSLRRVLAPRPRSPLAPAAERRKRCCCFASYSRTTTRRWPRISTTLASSPISMPFRGSSRSLHTYCRWTRYHLRRSLAWQLSALWPDLSDLGCVAGRPRRAAAVCGAGYDEATAQAAAAARL